MNDMNKEIKIKYVKKANQWCITHFVNGKHTQEWRSTKEEAQKLKDEILKGRQENK